MAGDPFKVEVLEGAVLSQPADAIVNGVEQVLARLRYVLCKRLYSGLVIQCNQDR